MNQGNNPRKIPVFKHHAKEAHKGDHKSTVYNTEQDIGGSAAKQLRDLSISLKKVGGNHEK